MRTPADNPWRWLLAFAFAALGCQPDIGDNCRNHSECAYSGTRICEPNFPGGYCTIFNCEPGTCPEESVCVAFQNVPSPRPECADSNNRRLQRTFCMYSCEKNNQCRNGDGYACVDLADKNQNPWGALVVERGSHNTRICTVPLSGDLAPAASGTAVAGVCSPPLDASFPVAVPTASPPEAGVQDGAASTPPPDASLSVP
jgi:hypothetical protein